MRGHFGLYVQEGGFREDSSEIKQARQVGG